MSAEVNDSMETDQGTGTVVELCGEGLVAVVEITDESGVHTIYARNA